ncbi:MAG: hypothetical protein NTY86_21085 [Deltaproteobacteria bacterium]|nr:hypothetical protein [Deltaproteobacteria bacterium]
MFTYGKFRWSEKFYKKALDLGASERCLALRADALMFAGEYKESSTIFQEYLGLTKKPEPQWILKKWAIDNIIQMTGIVNQNRQPHFARKLSIDFDETILENEKIIQKAFAYDALCEGAWIIRGDLFLSEKNLVESIKSTLIAAIISPSYIPYWSKFFIFTQFISNFDELIPLAIAYAYDQNGDNFLLEFSKIVKEVLPEEFFPIATRKKIIDLISKKIIEYGKKEEAKTVVRIPFHALPSGIIDEKR